MCERSYSPSASKARSTCWRDRSRPRSRSAACSAGTGSSSSTRVPNASIVTASRSAKRIRVQVAGKRHELGADLPSRFQDLRREQSEVTGSHRLEPPGAWIAAEVGERRSTVGGGQVEVRIETRQPRDAEGAGLRTQTGYVRPACLLDQVPEEAVVGDGREQTGVDE